MNLAPHRYIYPAYCIEQSPIIPYPGYKVRWEALYCPSRGHMPLCSWSGSLAEYDEAFTLYSSNLDQTAPTRERGRSFRAFLTKVEGWRRA